MHGMSLRRFCLRVWNKGLVHVLLFLIMLYWYQYLRLGCLGVAICIAIYNIFFVIVSRRFKYNTSLLFIIVVISGIMKFLY